MRQVWRVPRALRTAAVLASVWAALILVTAALKPGFLSAGTFQSIAFNMVIPGVVALGLALVTISGAQLDLSVGVTVAAAAVTTSTALRAGLGTGLAVLIGLATGLVVGAANVLLVVGVGINPIVATLATAFAGGGTLTVLGTGVQQTVPLDSGLQWFGRQSVFGLPVLLLIVLVLILAADFALDQTQFGRHLVAIGGSIKAAKARGLKLRRARVGALLACALLAGLGGVFSAAQTSILSTAPDPLLSYRVAAVVLLGGISLSGGRGRMLGLFASLLLLSTIPTVLVSLGASSSWQAVLGGGALFVAVSIDAYQMREKK